MISGFKMKHLKRMDENASLISYFKCARCFSGMRLTMVLYTRTSAQNATGRFLRPIYWKFMY